jgi:hypothetical protein
MHCLIFIRIQFLNITNIIRTILTDYLRSHYNYNTLFFYDENPGFNRPLLTGNNLYQAIFINFNGNWGGGQKLR